MVDGRGRAAAELVPYRQRPAFKAYHNRTQRWAVMVCHRRAGKTVAVINDLIQRTLLCKRERPRGAYIAPLHKQAKDAVWDYLKHYGLALPGAEVVNMPRKLAEICSRKVKPWPREERPVATATRCSAMPF